MLNKVVDLGSLNEREEVDLVLEILDNMTEKQLQRIAKKVSGVPYLVFVDFFTEYVYEDEF
jgi:hypothetical protein